MVAVSYRVLFCVLRVFPCDQSRTSVGACEYCANTDLHASVTEACVNCGILFKRVRKKIRFVILICTNWIVCMTCFSNWFFLIIYSAVTRAFQSNDFLANASNGSVRSYMTIQRPSAQPNLRGNRPNSVGKFKNHFLTNHSAGIHHSKYWMPIRYNRIEDAQNIPSFIFISKHYDSLHFDTKRTCVHL